MVKGTCRSLSALLCVILLTHGLPKALAGTHGESIAMGAIAGTKISSSTVSPTVGSFSPSSGPVGELVIINGSNFTGATSVNFNGVPCTFTVNSPTQLTAIVAARATTGKISVVTASGTGTSTTNYKVTPALKKFAPTSGPIGTSVVIGGAGLVGTTAVYFNGVAASNFVVNSNGTQITVSVPSGATTGTIAVVTGGGLGSSSSSFTVIPGPVIGNIATPNGNFGSTVVLTGANLTGVIGVSFNGLIAPYTVNSDTQISATVPPGATSGPVQILTRGGTSTSPTNFVVNPVAVRTLGWQEVGAGDFNGDGRPDLLWRNATTGVNRVWLMDGYTFVSQVDLQPLTGTDWQLVGAADFTGDGKPDLLWRNFTSGQNLIWRMDGTNYVESIALVPVTDPNFQLAGIGDLTGDQKPDLIWRNYSTGDIYVWQMDGSVYVQAFFIGNVVDPYWQLAGAGDFTNDGKADLLWRYWGTGAGTGDVYLWRMDGYTYQSFAYIGPVTDLDFQLTGIGDFIPDGQLDMVWSQNVNGDNFIWKMNGYTYQQSFFIGSKPTN